jgi:hypothetical protein
MSDDIQIRRHRTRIQNAANVLGMALCVAGGGNFINGILLTMKNRYIMDPISFFLQLHQCPYQRTVFLGVVLSKPPIVTSQAVESQMNSAGIS